MMSRSQVLASVTSHREQLMPYVILIVHEMAEKRIVDVVNQFCHRQLVSRAETRADSSANDCFETISVGCSAKAIRGTGSINKLGDNNRLENNL